MASLSWERYLIQIMVWIIYYIYVDEESTLTCLMLRLMRALLTYSPYKSQSGMHSSIIPGCRNDGPSSNIFGTPMAMIHVSNVEILYIPIRLFLPKNILDNSPWNALRLVPVIAITSPLCKRIACGLVSRVCSPMRYIHLWPRLW